MRILVSGASGFIGAPLFAHFLAQGHTVFRLVRKGGTARAAPQEIVWDPDQGKASKEDFEGFDAVFHLAGEPLSIKRWNRKKREKILYSRTVSTWFLSQLLSSLYHPPAVFISASAVGFYGDRGEELLDERSSPGNQFLSNVCVEWERASRAIEARGTRTLRARFGVVLDPKGGALKKMLLPYRLGLGAILGSGQQWMSWIALADLIRALDFLLHQEIEGAVNCVAPHPVRQADFARVLADHLFRPLFLRVPASLLRFLLGEVADTLLLASTRVVPTRLQEAGFTWKYPDLKNLFQGSCKILE